MILTSANPRENAMEKVQLSTDVLAKIGDVTFPAELCDEAGATRAVVLPVELYREMLSAWAGAAFREEDLARARSEPGGYTTAEAIAYLHKLVSDRSKQ
jgi:hypothetical protein